MTSYYNEQLRAKEYEIERRSLQFEKLLYLGESVSGIVHQIKKPIAALSASSHLLLAENVPEKMKEKAGIISVKAMECAKIIDDMLDFIKVKEVKKSNININTFIDKILNLTTDQFILDSINIIKKYDKDIPDVYVNVELIKQVFLNIINNARESILSTEKNGILTVETNFDRENIIIKFIDTGLGIPKDVIPKLFTPFYTTKEKGTGLGLSVANRIIVQHNGKIYATNNEPCGAIFVIELPYKNVMGTEP